MAAREHTGGVKVIGFDIEPSQTPLYSIVALDEKGNVVYKQEHATIARLIRLVWELRPEILACDNIFELSDDEAFLRKILSMLPDDVEVVQVTYMPDGKMLDLKSLAALAGIKVEGKLSPSKTAYLAALLALRGFGSRVVFREEKTKIIIAKARHGSAGGMSQLRYQRGVKTSILRAVRVIKKILDKHGFDYDLVFRKSGHGLESAVFIVYAPRKALYGILRGFEGKDIRVEIRPVYTGRLVFEARRDDSRSHRYIIVGVDPGTVTAVAGVDLQGRLVFIHSGKGLDRSDIINLIRRYGEAVLIATDVNPPPENVKKLAATLGVPLYTPPESLTVDEKQQLVASIVKQLKGLRLNAHERDALAAALRALREYSSKFRQIESAVSRYPAEISTETIKAKVLQGKTIAEAVEEEIERILVEAMPKPIVSVRHHQVTSNSNNTIDRSSESYIKELEAAYARIKRLEDELRSCRERIKSLENEIRIIRFDAASKAEEKLSEYKHRLSMLHAELEKLRTALQEKEAIINNLVKVLTSIAVGRLYPLPKLASITRTNVSKLQLMFGSNIKAVYVVNPAPVDPLAADTLARMGVRAAIAAEKTATQLSDTLAQYNIHVYAVPSDSVIELNEYLVAVPLNVVNEALSEAALSMLEKLSRTNNNGVGRELNIDDLRKLLEEYRRSRYAEL